MALRSVRIPEHAADDITGLLAALTTHESPSIEQYEALPHVQAAIQRVKDLRLAGDSWVAFKSALMQSHGIGPDQYINWRVPPEYVYAWRKRQGWRAGELARLLKKVLGHSPAGGGGLSWKKKTASGRT